VSSALAAPPSQLVPVAVEGDGTDCTLDVLARPEWLEPSKVVVMLLSQLASSTSPLLQPARLTAHLDLDAGILVLDGAQAVAGALTAEQPTATELPSGASRLIVGADGRVMRKRLETTLATLAAADGASAAPDDDALLAASYAEGSGSSNSLKALVVLLVGGVLVRMGLQARLPFCPNGNDERPGASTYSLISKQ
jgi:hypothetical protein